MTPSDHLAPNFDKCDRVHGWKNYASDELRTVWLQLEPDLRRILAENLQEIADREEWE